MKKYICSVCGYIYDDEKESIKFESLPDTWKCPLCGAPKSAFNEIIENSKKIIKEEKTDIQVDEIEDIMELSANELSIMCSNLSKGCEKQYLLEESNLYKSLSDYFASKVKKTENADFDILLEKINSNLSNEITVADKKAENFADRGAKRVLLWNRKVTTLLNALVERYKKEGSSMLLKTNIYVCSICGFIYIGDEAPEICPVCKVPRLKFIQVRRDI